MIGSQAVGEDTAGGETAAWGCELILKEWQMYTRLIKYCLGV